MPQRTRTSRLLLAGVLWLAAPALLRAQDIPARPPGMTDQQVQQLIQQRGLGEQLRQRIQQSGLTPDQVRARLRAAGYSENLVDAYMGGATGQAAPTPSLDVLRAAMSLGLGDFAMADTAMARRDSIVMSRADSFLLDTLDLVVGRDSIPVRRDSLGILRVDTAAVRILAERIRRPRVFGLDVFRRATNQFAVVTSGPVDPEYRLGPGDELALIVTGEVELAHSLPVTREGFIVVPQVGQIAVANLTLAQLRVVMAQRLGRVYSGVRAGPSATTRFDITVTRVRVNQIFVTGEVVRPGAYAVSAIGTVLNALYQAGGPTERGSFRQIRIMRAGQRIAMLDLYDYLVGGNSADPVRLESGDVIFVPTNGRRVTLEGRVVRPAIYELKEGDGLRELLTLAGGLRPDAFAGRASIERILPLDQRTAAGRDRQAYDVDLNTALASTAAPVPLGPDDRIRVYGIAQPVRNQVRVRGNVWQPGPVALTPGMRLSAALTAAGGIRPETFLERAHILRLRPDSTVFIVPVNLRTALAGNAGGPVRDPELQESDEIVIYSRAEFRPARQIAMYGSVQRPGALAFRDSMTLRDAVMLSGGLRDEAYLLEAEISRIPTEPGGDSLATILRVPLDSNYVLDLTGYQHRASNPRGPDVRLQPYDNVFIRRIPGYALPRSVVVSGEVLFPGRYTIARNDERITSLLQRAGGIMPSGYVRGAQFHRAEGGAGRVGIDLERVLRDPSFRDNLILLAGDSLHVPQYQPVVQVQGAVSSPVAVAFVPGHDAGYYVERAGGFSQQADKRRTYIVQPNGAVVRRGERVEPGAQVVVPAKPPDRTGPNAAQIVSTTTALLASLLSLVVLAKQL